LNWYLRPSEVDILWILLSGYLLTFFSASLPLSDAFGLNPLTASLIFQFGSSRSTSFFFRDNNTSHVYWHPSYCWTVSLAPV
jgi:hypothetical protein